MNNEVCQQCGEEADPNYTERFDILNDPNPMHFCSICGEMVKALKEDLDVLIEDC